MAGETGPSSERGSGRPASARALGPALLPPRRAARERRTIERHRGLMRLDAATAKNSKWLYFFFFFFTLLNSMEFIITINTKLCNEEACLYAQRRVEEV